MAEKGTVVVGCDRNSGQDATFQNTVCEKLESAGYTVEKLAIAPNPFAAYSYSSKAQGKYGVYIIADGTYSIADYHYGANKNKKSFKMAVFPIRTDLKKKLQGDDWDDIPVGADADYSNLPRDIVGKTFKQMNEMLKEDVRIVRGNTPEEMAKNVLAALGGKVSDGDGDSSASTIKDAIKEVMSAWDGEVECYVRDMKMYIHKIKLPEQDCNLILSEGLNIESRSINIKDYCPNNTNKLVVHWNGGEDIIIQDNTRIERFGEKIKEMDAVKRVLTSNNETKKETKDSTDTTTTTSNDDEKSDKGYEEVPAETYEEALEFAHLEWNKCKREDCHEIELSTIGGDEWQQGRWVRVYIPSFNIDGYYYISRVSENTSPSQWKASLTLVEYPPSFGEPEEETEEEEEETEEEETSEVSDDVTS